jgi:hypothetical protein
MTSLDEFNKHLDHFQSKGYNEVDTARMYVGGAQEAWTRDAKWKDRGLTLATKVYPAEPGMHKPEKLKELFTTSLKELDTDAVDIFYLHAPDHSTPFEETLGAVNELHKQGKFVQLGLSNFAAWEVAEVYNICKERGWVKPTIYQAMYNAISKSSHHQSTFTFTILTHSSSPRNRARTHSLLPQIQNQHCNLQPPRWRALQRQNQIRRHRAPRRPLCSKLQNRRNVPLPLLQEFKLRSPAPRRGRGAEAQSHVARDCVTLVCASFRVEDACKGRKRWCYYWGE